VFVKGYNYVKQITVQTKPHGLVLRQLFLKQIAKDIEKRGKWTFLISDACSRKHYLAASLNRIHSGHTLSVSHYRRNGAQAFDYGKPPISRYNIEQKRA